MKNVLRRLWQWMIFYGDPPRMVEGSTGFPDVSDICRKLEGRMTEEQRMRVIWRLKGLGWNDNSVPSLVYKLAAEEELHRFDEPKSTP